MILVNTVCHQDPMNGGKTIVLRTAESYYQFIFPCDSSLRSILDANLKWLK